jgi:hemoglobin
MFGGGLPALGRWQHGGMQPPGPQRVTIEGLGAPVSFYDAVGGHDTFEALVSGFYARVATDPLLSEIYPDHDWKAAAGRLMLFLEQYWGGPRTYTELRGHPRLRMRHAGFRIDQEAHDTWLAAMRAALDDVALAPEADAELWAYLVNAADMLINTD